MRPRQGIPGGRVEGGGGVFRCTVTQWTFSRIFAADEKKIPSCILHAESFADQGPIFAEVLALPCQGSCEK